MAAVSVISKQILSDGMQYAFNWSTTNFAKSSVFNEPPERLIAICTSADVRPRSAYVRNAVAMTQRSIAAIKPKRSAAGMNVFGSIT